VACGNTAGPVGLTTRNAALGQTARLVVTVAELTWNLPVSCRKFSLESPFSPIFEWFPVSRPLPPLQQ